MERMEYRQRDPGNPIIGLLMLLPILAFADYTLNGGQNIAKTLDLYIQINALLAATQSSGASNSVAGSGASVGALCLTLLVFGAVGLVVIKATASGMNKQTTLANEMPTAEPVSTGVGHQQNQRPRTASTFRKLKEV